MNFIKSLESIEDKYTHIVFDIWGVIHDGDSLYPDVIKNLKRLKSKNKIISFLSNAPRRASKARNVLNKFGVTEDLIDNVFTSGEIVFDALKENQLNNYSKYGNKCYYIGPKRDYDLLEGLQYTMVNNPSDSDFAVVTGFDDHETDISERKEEVESLIAAKIPMICANPDLIVVKKDGRSLPCAGQIAKYFSQLGGEVEYFGKPYEATYNSLINNLKTNKNNILIVGDGIETDITGAYNNEIDSIFITGGILSAKHNYKYNELPNKEIIKSEFDSYGVESTYILKTL